MGKSIHRTKAFRLSIAGLSLVVFLATVYLFRTEKFDNPSLGSIEHVYRWGFLIEQRADSNRDGRIDYRARFPKGHRYLGSHDSPQEFWEDRNHDALFEVHVIMDGDQIARVEYDSDADGLYDLVHQGEAANHFYRELTESPRKKTD